MDSRGAHHAFRENGDQEQRRADPELGHVYKLGGLHAFIINIRSVRRVQVAEQGHTETHLRAELLLPAHRGNTQLKTTSSPEVRVQGPRTVAWRL